MPNEGKIELGKNGSVLARIYTNLQDSVIRIFAKHGTNTKAIRDELKTAVDEVRAANQRYAQIATPDHYAEGMNEAGKILEKLGISISPPKKEIHKTIVQNMVDEVSRDLEKNVNALTNGVQVALSEAEQLQLRNAISDVSKSRKQVADEVSQILQRQGVQSLLDRGGKTWSVDSYAQMLVRTKRMQAYNSGVINRSLENDVQVFRVSFTGSSHKACARWEDKLLSYNGEFGLPTVEEAKASGLFHPNCFHSLLPEPLEQMKLERAN